ncbi:MAG TPA: DinB family protein [Vicinamibacterales bacterium]|nr:DinB family protein [Vicinamibacterales bacterium]
MTVADVSSELRTMAASFSKELLVAGSDVAARRPAGSWSPKEVLGHLIDSAANNHQRFVRAQQAEALTFPGYEQNQWVSSQGYQDADWAHLVALWTHLNLHLANVIERIPPSKYSAPCTIGGDAAVPLEAIVIGYRNHLHHHIAQIRERLSL